MNDQTLNDIAAVLSAGISLWANHLGKPAGWTPTAQDWDDLLVRIESDSPAKIEAEIKAESGQAGS